MDDDFVPEGCVPLKSAVEQLAEARQISIQSAQVNGRAKLHSGLMRAVVLRSDTGELLEILTRCWATETALRWFETGTCLLPNENGKVRITAERFDMFYQPENAPIFILEVDLKRLISSATARCRSAARSRSCRGSSSRRKRRRASGTVEPRRSRASA